MGEITSDLDELRELCKEDPNLGSGVYVTAEGKAYVIGVIDPLTAYGFIKVVEFWYKKNKYDGRQSCIPPDQYCARFE